MDQNGAKDFKLEFGAVKRNANQFLHFRWGLVVSLFSFGFSGLFLPSFFPTSDSNGAKVCKSCRSRKTLKKIWMQKTALIQPRTGPLKFDHFAENPEKGSILNLSQL